MASYFTEGLANLFGIQLAQPEPNERLAQYLPPSYLEMIPEQDRATMANLAHRSAMSAYSAGENPMNAAQQTLLKLIEASASAKKAETVREETDKLLNPERRAMAVGADAGSIGPTNANLARSKDPAALLPSFREAAQLKAMGGMDLTDYIKNSTTPIKVEPGVNIDPLKRTQSFTPRVPDNFIYDPVSKRVSLAPGALEAAGAQGQQQSQIDINKAIRTAPLMKVPGPNGDIYVNSITGLPQPIGQGDAPRAPEPPAQPAPMAPTAVPAPSMSFPARIQQAVKAGEPETVLQLEAEWARSQGRPVPLGETGSYRRAVENARKRFDTDTATSSAALTATVQKSFNDAQAAADALPKMAYAQRLIDEGVYARQGVIPGDIRLQAARMFGGDPNKITNTSELKVMAIGQLLDLAQKLRPASDTDLKLLQGAINDPDKFDVPTLRRITAGLMRDYQSQIRKHGETLKRFDPDRVSAAFGGQDLTVKDPTPQLGIKIERIK